MENFDKIKEVEFISKDVKILIFKTDVRIRENDIELMEERLTTKLGIKCVIVDGMFSKIIGVKGNEF